MSSFRSRRTSALGALCVLALSALLTAPGLVAAQVTELGPATMPGSWSPDEELKRIQSLVDHLELDVEEALLAGRVLLEPEVARKDALDSGTLPGPNGLVMVGVNSETDIKVAFDTQSLLSQTATVTTSNKGVLRRKSSDEFVWTIAIESPGAQGLRVSLEEMHLLPGVELFIYALNDDGVEAHGPYTGRGVNDNGAMWTNTVFSDLAFLELRAEAGVSLKDFAESRFRIAEVAHMGGPNFFPKAGAAQRSVVAPLSDSEGLSSEEIDKNTLPSCLTDSNCATNEWASLTAVHNAFGFMIFNVPGGQAICTGQLLNDTVTSFTPHFLTANHCLSTQATANSLEVFFRYRTTSCNASRPFFGSFPRTVGSTLLATRTQSDMTLLRLNQNPPPGSMFLGWSAQDPPAAGVTLYRLSHPSGEPLKYTRHQTLNRRFTCTGVTHTAMIHTTRVIGDVLGGSSGSAIMRADGTVIGQLFGACGTRHDISCNNDFSDVIDGAFATSFPFISQFLSPTPPPTITIVVPAGDQQVANGTTTFAFSGTATAPSSTISRIEWRRNSGTWQIASGTTNWSFTATGLTVGENLIEVRTLNGAGSFSSIASRTITRRPPPPTVTVNTPSGNISITNGTTSVGFAGTASAPGSSLSTVALRLNGGGWQNASGTSSWTHTITGIPEGTNTVEVAAVNALGDVSPIVSRTITRAFAAPVVVSVLSPSSNLTVDNATTSLVVSGSAGTNSGSINLVQWRRNGGTWTNATGTTSWSFTVTNLAVGETTIDVRARNSSGQFSELRSFTIARQAASPPTVTLVAPRQERIVGANANATTIQGIAVAPGSTVNLVQYRIRGGSWLNASGTNSWTANASGFIVGPNLIEVRARNTQNVFGPISSVVVTRLSQRAPLNVMVTAIDATTARVSFTTNFATRSRISYNAVGQGLATIRTIDNDRTEHEYILTSLTPKTTYQLRVFGLETNGAEAPFNSSGSEIVFTTMAAHEPMAQLFPANTTVNLQDRVIRFTPDTNRGGYRYSITTASGIPRPITGATPLTLNDDDSIEVSFGDDGRNFDFFQKSYSRVFVGSNGYLTFESRSTNISATATTHFVQPRISPFFVDLVPSLAPGDQGKVFVELLADRFVVTYNDVPFFGIPSERLLAQVSLFFASGEIEIWYGRSINLGGSPAIIGLSSGANPGQANNLSANFTTVTPTGSRPTSIQRFNMRSSAGGFSPFFDASLPETSAFSNPFGTTLDIANSAVQRFGSYARVLPTTVAEGGIYRMTVRGRSSNIDRRLTATTRIGVNQLGFQQNALLVNPGTAFGRATMGLANSDHVLYFRFDGSVQGMIPSVQMLYDQLNNAETQSLTFRNITLERFNNTALGSPTRTFTQNLRNNRTGWVSFAPGDTTPMTFTGDGNGLTMTGTPPTGGRTMTYGTWLRFIDESVFQFRENRLYEVVFNLEGTAATDALMRNHPTTRVRIDAATFESSSLFILESTGETNNIPRSGQNRSYRVYYVVPPGMEGVTHSIGYDMYYIPGDGNDPAVGVRLRNVTINEYMLIP